MTRPDLRMGVARSMEEMRFYVEHLHPCPTCGARAGQVIRTDWYSRVGDVDDPDEAGAPAGLWEVQCRRCQRSHSVEFVDDIEAGKRLAAYKGPLRPKPGMASEPEVQRRLRYLGVPGEPSHIIEPHQLAQFVEEAVATIPKGRAQLPYDAWIEWKWHLYEVLTALNELGQFVPEGASEVAEELVKSEAARTARAEHPHWFTAAWVAGELARWTALHEELRPGDLERAALPPSDPRNRQHGAEERPPVLPPLSGPSLLLHAKWLADPKGTTGDRLRARGTDARGIDLAERDLSGALLEDVNLDEGRLAYVKLHAAKLTRVTARRTNLGFAMLAGTEIDDCDFAGSVLEQVNIGDATVLDSSFRGCNLERSTWYRARVTGCVFAGAYLHNAAYNDAVFVDCDFRGVDFSMFRPGILGTGWRARFERCDLRDTKWAGVDLLDARFIDCQFAGASGAPILTGVTVEGADIGGIAELRRMLGVGEAG